MQNERRGSVAPFFFCRMRGYTKPLPGMIWIVGRNNRRIRESESGVEVINSGSRVFCRETPPAVGGLPCLCLRTSSSMEVSLRHFEMDWIG